MAKLSEPSATEIVAADQSERVFRGQPDAMWLDGDMRIEPVDHRRRAVDLRHAEVRRGMDHLPLQVRQRDHVVVDDAERADPGGGQVKQHRRAEAAGADHQHPRAAERGLSWPAHLAQHDVARIAFEFVGTEHGLNISANGARNHLYRCAALRSAYAVAGAFGVLALFGYACAVGASGSWT